MRSTFIEFIEKQALVNKNLILVTADLGYGIFDQFREKFPDQFINVGVAEQNMIGISTGLAMVGLNPICYSLGNFPTMRCLEQIRNDAAYHDANLTIVSSGGGFGYGQLGMSHHATEDLGILHSIPNVQIFVPATKKETSLILDHQLSLPAIKYIRLEKSGPEINYINSDPMNDGYALYKQGSDILLVASGSILKECVEAANELNNMNISASVASLSIVKSLNPSHSIKLKQFISQFKYVISAEEHNRLGGIGTTIAEAMAESATNTKLVRLGLNDCFTSVVGDQNFLRKTYGLDHEAIIENALKLFNKKS